MSIIYKLLGRNSKRTDALSLFLTAVLTAIVSEVKIIPFYGEDLRFGLGSITFFYLSLFGLQLLF